MQARYLVSYYNIYGELVYEEVILARCYSDVCQVAKDFADRKGCGDDYGFKINSLAHAQKVLREVEQKIGMLEAWTLPELGFEETLESDDEEPAASFCVDEEIGWGKGDPGRYNPGLGA